MPHGVLRAVPAVAAQNEHTRVETTLPAQFVQPGKQVHQIGASRQVGILTKTPPEPKTDRCAKRLR